MSDFTAALERELERLETEIKNDPRFRRMQQIRALLTDYKAATPSAPAPPPLPPAHRAMPPMPSRPSRVRLSKAVSVRLAVQEFLTENGTMHRSAILKYLIGRDILGHEKNPMAALAAYLSDFKGYFTPDGRGNFSLKKSLSEAGSGAGAPVSH